MSTPTGALDVTTPSQVAAVAEALVPISEFAVDVEADSMHHYRSRLCFVQVGTDHDIFLLDTLAEGVRADALAQAFVDPAKTKFFHASQGDLQFLAEADVRVRGLFDTHRAATLLGWPKLGLADLVKEICGQTLKKEHQQSDFSLRPLPADMREYIADDVRYLNVVGRRVREACNEAGILEEVTLDCDRLCDEATARPDLLGSFRPKLPRAGLSAQDALLAEHIAQTLHRLRLGWAEAADVPFGRMLSNAAIAAIATRRPETARDLSRLEGVRGPFVRQYGDQTLAVLRELEAKKAELLPLEEKVARDPRRRKREEALLDWRKKTATQRKVTPSVVLPNSLIEALSDEPPASVDVLAKVPYFGKRRLELHGSDIVAVLAPLR